MDFFEDPPSEHNLPFPSDFDPEQPEWAGPPRGVLPGPVPIELVLGRSRTVAIALTRVRAYPAGVSLTLEGYLNPSLPLRNLDPKHTFGQEFSGGARVDDEHSAGRLRWGVKFADGRTATSVAPQWPTPQEGPPRGPVLLPQRGHGSDRHGEQEYWLWPLPPAGPLSLACEWTARGVGHTVHDIDAGLLREAAERAQLLWPEGE